MSLSPAEMQKIFDECDRKEKETVSELVIKDVMKRVSDLDWPMHEDNILIGWHYEFAVIDFRHKPSDFGSILTRKRDWLEGRIDEEYVQALERRFSKQPVCW